MGQLSVKDIISLRYLTPRDINKIFEKASELKQLKDKGHSPLLLRERTLCIICEKPSLRTRVSYEVAMTQLGGHAITLKAIPGCTDSDLHLKESDQDMAHILDGYVDAIVARTFSYEKIENLAKFAHIPVINGLCNLTHPVKMLADLFTMLLYKGYLKKLNIAYIGDSGNNMAHSLLLGASKLGANLTLASPLHDKYRPQHEFWELAQENAKESGSTLKLITNPVEAVKNADIVYTDVWVSMGMEDQHEQRLEDFHNYQVNQQLISSAPNSALIMHPLPRTTYEMSDEIAYSKRTIMFEQAALKLHVEKAILVLLIT